MSHDPTPLPIFARQNRRDFLRTVAGAGLGLVLAGCGGGDGGGVASSGGSSASGGSSPGPVPGIPSDSLPPVSIRGAVDATQIGGSNLNVLSAFQLQADVSGGSFDTFVSPNLAQTLIVRDGAGSVRGMVVNVPTDGNAGSPTVDASTTAAAVVFFSPGIGASDATLAAQRLALITGAASFGQLVAALAALLPTLTLPQALADAGVQAAMQAVVTQVLDAMSARRFQGRTAEEQQEIDRSGGVWLERNTESPYDAMEVTLNNEGWRFLSVVRQDFDGGGNELRVVVPEMDGSVLPGAKSVMQGINGISFGSLFNQSTGDAGTATDTFNADAPEVARSVYWIRGLGSPLHPYNTPIPASVRDQDFVTTADGMTVVYYFLLPLFEPFLAAGKSLGYTQAEAIEKIFTPASLLAAGSSVQAAAATDNEGNIALAMVDACAALLAVGTAGLAALLAGQIVVAGPVGLVLAAVEAILATVASVMSALNLFRSARYLLRVPRYADVDLRLPGAKSLELLGPVGGIQVLDVNENGTMVYYVPDAGLFYRKFGSSPVLLLPEQGEAVLNAKDQVLFQDTARQRHALLRLTSGETIPVTPPPVISASPTATGVLALSNDGHGVCSFDRDDGRGGAVYDVFTAAPGGGFASLEVQLAKPGVVDLAPTRSSDTIFVGQTFVDGTKYLATKAYDNQPWTFSLLANTFSDSINLVDMNHLNQKLLKRLTITGDAFDGFKFRHEIVIESNNGDRSVLASVEDVPTSDGGFERFQLNPVAINETGEVAGTLRRPSKTTALGEGILWSRSGLPQEIANLVPANAPSGNWAPTQMRGRFLILEHEESGGVYLFHRGR